MTVRRYRSGRIARTPVVIAGAAAGTVGAAIGLSAHFARRVLTPARLPEARTIVRAVDSDADGRGRIWLRGPDAALPGKYSFIFDDGSSHARLGAALEQVVRGRDRLVAREVLAVDRGSLRPGARGRVTGWWYTDPAELGFETRRVGLRLEGGPSWAWIVSPPADRALDGRWAIHVHGRGALPEETLRGVAPFARAGITSLILAYRNDPGAPRGLRGRYGLGLAESRDVDAALAWVREQGATSVTLAGWSMGGTACLIAAARGPQHGLVDGLVLDSPAVDWSGLLDRQARLSRVPTGVARLAGALMQLGIVRGAVPGRRSTDIASLSPERFAAELRVPVLIHASPGDTFVPWEGARRLAELKPESVRLRQGAGEHVKLWNVDPGSWERATETFVRGLTEGERTP
ncbi:hypothetical protein J4H92_07860 [Leucobacter weissii]|uniref:Alpha/beta hydrolase n=1 Tax=Leucobacter weissii TaxID=1983706 RepID=A0A939MN51_9MICO|nr:hypothetical protein [Leucobacter weissii]MBO1901862.1 hypothetical protein [Leucobacter weissii]